MGFNNATMLCTVNAHFAHFDLWRNYYCDKEQQQKKSYVYMMDDIRGLVPSESQAVWAAE